MSDLETAIGLLGNIFTMFVVNMFFTAFFPWDYSRTDKFKRLACFIVYYMVNSMAVFALHASPFITLGTNVAGYLLVSFTYKGGVRRKICAMVLIFVLSVACENLVAYFVLNFRLRHETLTIILVSNIVLYFIAVVLNKRLKRDQLDRVKPIEWISITVISLASLFMSVVILYECVDEVKALIGGICIVAVNMFLIYAVDRLQRDYERELEYSLMEQENQAYKNQVDIISESEKRIRALRHDMKNHLMAVSKLAEEENCKTVSEYVNGLMTEGTAPNSFSETGNTILDGLINMKLGDAESAGADIEVQMKVPDKIDMDSRDMVALLGNLLDNSVSAVTECRERRFIRLKMEAERGIMIVEVENSYNGILNEKYGKLYSTKPESSSHGLGLYNVKRVVEKYNGEMRIEHDDNTFKVKVMLFV